MRSPSVILQESTDFSPMVILALRVLFGLSVLIAAVATYLTVSDSGNASTAGSPVLMWFLIINIVIIAILMVAFALRIYYLVIENRATNGGARLRLRIMTMFGLAAMLPTVIAALLGTSINQSVEGWFSQRVYQIVETATEAAGEAYRAEVDDVEENLREVARDLDDEAVQNAFTESPEQFQEFLAIESDLRNLPALKILDASRSILYSVTSEDAPDYVEMSETNWIAANKSGTVAVNVSDDFAVRAMIKLEGYQNTYLYGGIMGSREVAAQLKATNATLNEYRDADNRKNSLRTVFILAYLETAILVLLGAAWLGLHAAGSITKPIGELASAARAVRDGDLSVRLERPQAHDEIDDLSEAFNQMTMRLARQRREIDSARLEAETRSEFIETVLSGVEAGVVRIDATFNITLANASAGRLLGLTVDELTGKRLDEVAPEFLTPLRNVIERKEAQGANTVRVNNDTPMDIHMRISPETDLDGYVITFHDTTRLVAGQRQAAWRDVARRIAHEIRNPLTPIQLSAERLRRRFAKQIEVDRDTFDSCTETILRQVGDIGRMVEEFSSFARMPKPTLAPFDLCELVENIAFAQRLAAPNVLITSTVPEHKIVLTGDERLLGQALTNLVKNAREAVERNFSSGETIHGSVTLTVESKGNSAVIIVRDTGPGFPVENRDRILEPYVTTRENGVGLGLAIVSRIVEDHGGQISLADNEMTETGARVEVTLPLMDTKHEDGNLADLGEQHDL